MRVIQKGDIDKPRKLRDKKYKTTCPHCGGVLEFGSEEIERSLAEGDNVYYIACPLCTYYFNYCRANMKPYTVPNMVEIEEVIE